MVADAFTKDQGGPLDLLRSAIRHYHYQLADDQVVLDRNSRKNRGVGNQHSADVKPENGW
jgi:hypothetical protein